MEPLIEFAQSYTPDFINIDKVVNWTWMISSVLGMILMGFHFHRERQCKCEPRCDPKRHNPEKGLDLETPKIASPPYYFWKEEIFWYPGEVFIYSVVELGFVAIIWSGLQTRRGRVFVVAHVLIIVYTILLSQLQRRFRFRGLKLSIWQVAMLSSLPLWWVYYFFDLGLPGQAFLFGDSKPWDL